MPACSATQVCKSALPLPKIRAPLAAAINSRRFRYFRCCFPVFERRSRLASIHCLGTLCAAKFPVAAFNMSMTLPPVASLCPLIQPNAVPLCPPVPPTKWFCFFDQR
jgi:hypothetical protein